MNSHSENATSIQADEEKVEYNPSHLDKLNDCLKSVFSNFFEWPEIKFVFDKKETPSKVEKRFRLDLGFSSIRSNVKEALEKAFGKYVIPLTVKYKDSCMVIDVDCNNIGNLMKANSQEIAMELKKYLQKAADNYYQKAFEEEKKKTDKSKILATSYYESAITLNHTKAKTNLAYFYLTGKLPKEKNINLALQLLIEAANEGHARAQLNLGKMYKEGDGVDKNLEEACKWYKKAADAGDETAKQKLTKIEQQIYGEVNPEEDNPEKIIAHENKPTELMVTNKKQPEKAQKGLETTVQTEVKEESKALTSISPTPPEETTPEDKPTELMITNKKPQEEAQERLEVIVQTEVEEESKGKNISFLEDKPTELMVTNKKPQEEPKKRLEGGVQTEVKEESKEKNLSLVPTSPTLTHTREEEVDSLQKEEKREEKQSSSPSIFIIPKEEKLTKKDNFPAKLKEKNRPLVSIPRKREEKTSSNNLGIYATARLGKGNKKSNIGGLLGSLLVISIALPTLLFCFLPTTALGILLVVAISLAAGGIGYWGGNKIQQWKGSSQPVRSASIREKSQSPTTPFNGRGSTVRISKTVLLENTNVTSNPSNESQGKSRPATTKKLAPFPQTKCKRKL